MAAKEIQHGFVSYFSIGLVRIILVVILLILLRNAIWLPAMLLLFLVTTIEGAFWWSKLGLRGLAVEKTFTYIRFFPGESTKLTVKITNKKSLPSIAGWQQDLPSGWTVAGTEYIEEKAIMLMGGENYSIEYELLAKKRGYWQIPDSKVSSSDGLGLFEQSTVIQDAQWMIVYPEIIPLESIGIKVSDLIGEQKVQRPFLPDPIRLVSLREYTMDMPSRLIHWKASMSKDRLLAKVLEPSADYKLCVLLDVEYFYTEQDDEKFEKAISTAASILVRVQEKDIPFGLLINGRQKGREGPFFLPVGQGIEHLATALEGLARLEFIPVGKLKELLRLEGTTLPAGTSFIYIGGCGSSFDGHAQNQELYFSVS